MLIRRTAGNVVPDIPKKTKGRKKAFPEGKVAKPKVLTKEG